MYSYKLNNSYTVYVNYAYLNECAKICKNIVKTRAKPNAKSRAKPNAKSAPEEKPTFTPLPKNTAISHKTFGNGNVISTDKKGIMLVCFSGKTVKFVYPDAVKQGFLTLIQQ